MWNAHSQCTAQYLQSPISLLFMSSEHIIPGPRAWVTTGFPAPFSLMFIFGPLFKQITCFVLSALLLPTHFPASVSWKSQKDRGSLLSVITKTNFYQFWWSVQWRVSYEHCRANEFSIISCNLNTIYTQTHTMYSLLLSQ